MKNIPQALIFLEIINDINVKINIHYCTINKKHTFSGLEVADFIIHSAVTALRDRINGKIRNLTDREDFDNIFKNKDSKYSSFIQIDSAVINSME